MKIIFRIDGDNLRVLTKDMKCSVYHAGQALWKSYGIASTNFDCFTIGESDQAKISREIMQCQG